MLRVWQQYSPTCLLYVSYKKKSLLKPAEYLIINLAISDLGVTLTLYPLAVTSSLSHRWLYGKQICLFYAFCGVLFGICSLSTLTLQSTVCCLKIRFPAYVIVTSYSLILVTVKESREGVEQHVSGPARMSSAQTITVKLSVAVCVRLFAAWSPFAVIAMWAVFGSIDKISPLAFAVPAVFAKSSTLYNPVIYLLLKPNFRNTIAKDFTVLQQLFISSWFSVKASQNYRTTMNTIQRTFKGKTESSCNSLPIVEECSYFSHEKCSNSLDCFQSYPKCCQESLSDMECPPQETVPLESNLQAKVRQNNKKSVKVVVLGGKSTEINSLEITLEAVPVCHTFTDL